MNVEHSMATSAARRRPSVAKRGAGLVGLAVLLATAAGCAVSQADTISPTQHRNNTSIFSAVAGVTTSELTSAFPSTTSAQVVDGTVKPAVDGQTEGSLADLSQSAAWSLTLDEKIDGMRLGPMYGSDSVAPLQVGNVMLVGLRSSVLNEAGTAAFSMTDGSLLWQDRSLECQRVDLGGAVPCRQNAGEWAPFNPGAGAFGPALNPGFAPEAFGFADGVLYSARTNGAGMIEVAAGTVENPAGLWTVAVPRSAEAMIPGEGAAIRVGDTVKVTMGAAEIELTKDGAPLTATAQAAQPADGAMVVDIEQTIGDTHIANTVDDRISSGTWSIPSRVVSKNTVTDGERLTYVAGDDADGSNVIRTISLVDGKTVSEHSVVANAAEPRDIQSAARGIFAFDKQFSRIAYYPAG
ncbi:hypothetical protein CKALI_05340 [Corynebacterium kalinowskii]|uniref:Uncharacterized protein n=1 Tax=Corynebacterium kalinowskii TaxID=2675216 RepID=A0A6B8VG20_9CORY|nr:hypothetical protein [Corynebacterium kalinowskii]QGU01939.1 hypothetical protein CKALI_05340 [Corynebacterium kalinowskii]